MVGKPVQQGTGHFLVLEDAIPFFELQISGDYHWQLLIPGTHQVEQQLCAL